MLRVPCLGILRKACGSMLPYAAVTARSGCRAANASRKGACRETGARHASVYLYYSILVLYGIARNAVIVCAVHEQDSARARACTLLTAAVEGECWR